MKKWLFLSLILGIGVFYTAFLPTAESKKLSVQNKTFPEINPQAFRAAAAGVSEKVSSFAPPQPNDSVSNKKTADEKARAVPNNLPFRKQIENFPHDTETFLNKFSAAPMPTPSLSFDGLSSEDNASAYGFRIIPPDPFGDVGPNHYVQAVNALVRVFDKQGNALTPPFKLSSMFAPLGTPCAQRNDGDPIVLYDALADRWFLSQFCTLFPPFRQMIAVSKTGDPTGEYYIYEFVMPNMKLNDYSKIGVWSDGYYMSSDEFLGGDYAGTGVFAFDRSKLLVGDSSASYVYFDLASPTTLRIGGLLPSDFDGLKPPLANAPNVFVGYAATEYGDPFDAIRLFDFHADFQNPPNSKFTERAESPVVVSPFDPTSPEGRNDVDQPPPGEKLDSQSDRLMYRVGYRNFGAHESLVFNQTVRVSPVGQTYRAGVRLYELRRGAAGFSVHEQMTVGSADTNRWMASTAQDHQGNLAVGYSIGNEEKPISIYYTGKLASAAAGTTNSEAGLIAGTGVQTAFGFRWGDYSSMSIDPSDDCTFWLTNEYFTLESQKESPFGWLTRVGKFRFAECTDAPRATISGIVTNAANGQPISDGVVTTLSYSRQTGTNGKYGNLLILPDTYSLTASARGFRSQTVNVTISNGQALTQNFALEPTVVFENGDLNITDENCEPNRSIDPGETVTANIGLANTGAGNTINLTATLLAVGGVTNPSPPQNYGVLANGVRAYRSFTFTASPDLKCGETISLTFALQDGAENFGTLTINVPTGKPRIAFQENFGFTGTPNLPVGWTTSATGAQQVWKTVINRHQTPPNSAYSPNPNQIGINELVSPVFQINSAAAELSFQNWYELETTFLRNKLYDGSVLEIKIGAGAWQDIETAGGAFISGGYDGKIDSCCQNPLAGRRAWSGKSGVNQTPVFVTSKAKLPASAAGQNVQLRWRVGTDVGTFREGQYIDDVVVSDGYVCNCLQKSNRAPFDFDGDGKTDFSVFRPNDNPNEADFHILQSSSNSQQSAAWGSVGDAAANADYDGDGKTDLAVFRSSTRTWFILQSSNNTILPIVFGTTNDKLTPADFDGDGKADLAVFRPTNGTWHVLQSTNGEIRSQQFGTSGDLPVAADFDADGKTDLAVFRPSNGVWYISRSSDNSLINIQFGLSGDKPVPGNYDGDAKSDIAVFRPSDGNWYLLRSSEGFTAVHFGISGDKPLQADFDGDARQDIAVYRPGTNIWYYLKSSDGSFVSAQYGAIGDTVVPSIFVP